MRLINMIIMRAIFWIDSRELLRESFHALNSDCSWTPTMNPFAHSLSLRNLKRPSFNFINPYKYLESSRVEIFLPIDYVIVRFIYTM